MRAFSGFAWLIADDDEATPRRIRHYAFVDLVTSAVIAEALCAALLLRRRQGGAVRVETSMLHAVMEASRSDSPRSRPRATTSTEHKTLRVPAPPAPLPGADTPDVRAASERFWRSEMSVAGPRG